MPVSSRSDMSSGTCLCVDLFRADNSSNHHTVKDRTVAGASWPSSDLFGWSRTMWHALYSPMGDSVSSGGRRASSPREPRRSGTRHP